MELVAAGPEPVAYAYGAYLHGGRLRCGLLFVRRGQPDEPVTLRCPTTTQEFRVRLPKDAIQARRDVRFTKETLEVLP